MAISQEHGRWGEDQACLFLEKAGFDILQRNWRYKRAELDIIAREQGILVFAEVKTRAGLLFGQPEVSVTRRKQRLLIDAAMAYMRATDYDWEIRFDIVSVIGEPGRLVDIRHYRDTFFPGLGYGEGE